jgi:hypothetical protein
LHSGACRLVDGGGVQAAWRQRDSGGLVVAFLVLAGW